MIVHTLLLTNDSEVARIFQAGTFRIELATIQAINFQSRAVAEYEQQDTDLIRLDPCRYRLLQLYFVTMVESRFGFSTTNQQEVLWYDKL